jgi:flagellar basal body-associated protein FliL
MADDPNKNESHIPFTLLLTILVLCIVLVIALPVMGIMYLDMNNATIAANEEIRKMKELRLKLLMQGQ